MSDIQKTFMPKTSPYQYPNNIFESWIIYCHGYNERHGYNENEQYRKLADTKFTEDQMKGLEYAISTLTEREQIAIRARYQEKKSYDEMYDDLHVTRERCRQIINKACAKLRNISRFRFIYNGYEATIADKGYQDEQAAIEAKNKKNLVEKELKLKVSLDDSIDEMDIPVRGIKCMHRAGLSTVKDVVDMITNVPDVFIKIRNLGVYTMYEINKVLLYNNLITEEHPFVNKVNAEIEKKDKYKKITVYHKPN